MYATPAPSTPKEIAIPALHPALKTPEYLAITRGSLVLISGSYRGFVSRQTHMEATSH